jgi:hypothetical protein
MPGCQCEAEVIFKRLRDILEHCPRRLANIVFKADLKRGYSPPPADGHGGCRSKAGFVVTLSAKSRD